MTLFDIIQKLSVSLKEHENINALWLEGSWATGKNNDQSDIDVWLDVADDSFDETVNQFRQALSRIGTIDWETSRGVYSTHPKLQKHTFHLAGFPELQRIELDLQQHRRNFVFDRNEHVIKVLFDKYDVIRWK